MASRNLDRRIGLGSVRGKKSIFTSLRLFFFLRRPKSFHTFFPLFFGWVERRASSSSSFEARCCSWQFALPSPSLPFSQPPPSARIQPTHFFFFRPPPPPPSKPPPSYFPLSVSLSACQENDPGRDSLEVSPQILDFRPFRHNILAVQTTLHYFKLQNW